MSLFPASRHLFTQCIVRFFGLSRLFSALPFPAPAPICPVPPSVSPAASVKGPPQRRPLVGGARLRRKGGYQPPGRNGLPRRLRLLAMTCRDRPGAASSPAILSGVEGSFPPLSHSAPLSRRLDKSHFSAICLILSPFFGHCALFSGRKSPENLPKIHFFPLEPFSDSW